MVKLSLALMEHHGMEAYWGAEIQLHAFLTSELDGGEWSASRPGRFIPTERTRGTHWIGSCMGFFYLKTKYDRNSKFPQAFVSET
jgi:hypothetical protein